MHELLFALSYWNEGLYKQCANSGERGMLHFWEILRRLCIPSAMAGEAIWNIQSAENALATGALSRLIRGSSQRYPILSIVALSLQPRFSVNLSFHDKSNLHFLTLSIYFKDMDASYVNRPLFQQIPPIYNPIWFSENVFPTISCNLILTNLSERQSARMSKKLKRMCETSIRLVSFLPQSERLWEWGLRKTLHVTRLCWVNTACKPCMQQSGSGRTYWWRSVSENERRSLCVLSSGSLMRSSSCWTRAAVLRSIPRPVVGLHEVRHVVSARQNCRLSVEVDLTAASARASITKRFVFLASEQTTNRDDFDANSSRLVCTGSAFAWLLAYYRIPSGVPDIKSCILFIYFYLFIYLNQTTVGP